MIRSLTSDSSVTRDDWKRKIEIVHRWRGRTPREEGGPEDERAGKEFSLVDIERNCSRSFFAVITEQIRE